MMQRLSGICLGILLVLATVPVQAATQQAVISWADVGATETGYTLERRVCGTGTYAQVGTVAANVVTFTDAALVQGTNFGWRVTAINAVGAGVPSDEVCMATAGVPGKVGPLTITIQIVP